MTSIRPPIAFRKTDAGSLGWSPGFPLAVEWQDVMFRQRCHDDLRRFGRRYPADLLDLRCRLDVVTLRAHQKDIGDDDMIRLVGGRRLKLPQKFELVGRCGDVDLLC